MQSPDDDFFTPRPKLRWNVRFIRAAALLMATAISACFLWIDFAILNTVAASALSSIAVVTVFQLILLLPCWRAWMLRRWACLLLICMLLIPLCFVPAFKGWATVGVAFISVLLLHAMIEEWDYLKSGF